MHRTVPLLTLGFFLAAAPMRAAETGSAALEGRFKSALNDLALKVKSAETPEAKRAILLRFADGMDQGLQEAESYAAVTPEDRPGIDALRSRFHANALELRGGAGLAPVPDADLDEYAAYMRQQMEQAPVGGGIYISAGALLIIILILVLIL